MYMVFRILAPLFVGIGIGVYVQRQYTIYSAPVVEDDEAALETFWQTWTDAIKEAEKKQKDLKK
jgi:prefoldin subunit 5